jgi:hypothetical protein
VLAAVVEGYVSASNLPSAVKAQVAILSAALIIAYLALGGRTAQSPASSGPAPAP